MSAPRNTDEYLTVDLRTADVVSDRRRQTCGDCGRRRMCTDYVWFGVPGVGYTLCDDCSVAALSGRSGDAS